MIYCVKCRTKTQDENVQQTVAKNGRHMMKAKCGKCGTTKCQIVAGVKGNGFIGSLLPF